MQLTKIDAENVTKMHLEDNNAIPYTYNLLINSLHIHKYWLNIVRNNINNHLYYIWIPFDMYVTQIINNCKKISSSGRFSQKPKTCTINRLIFCIKLPLPPCYHAFFVVYRYIPFKKLLIAFAPPIWYR